MDDLFLNPPSTFEKTAGEVSLPEDPNVWPNEILQELYKQVPYIADFHPNIIMDRVDGERGYALGHVEVMNKTELQAGTPQDALDAAGVKMVRIPVVVKDRKLQPFDVLVTTEAKMLPLTEGRIRQALFRPQAFDVTSRSPGDMSMIGQLYPPYRQNYGFGGGGASMSAGMGKQGSAQKGTMLERILPSINESDYHRFVDSVAGDEWAKFAYATNPAVTPSLAVLSKFQPGMMAKRAAAMPHMITPSVVQVVKAEDGYVVKTGSHNFWAPFVYEADRGRIVRDFGPKVALAADMDGSVTMVEGGVGDEAEAAPHEPISSYGVYEVTTPEGETLTGVVIPNLIDLSGTALPIALFTDNTQVAVQAEICGKLVSTEGVNLHWGDHPQGKGFFARELPDGGMEATVPLDVQASISNEGEVQFVCETYDGLQKANVIVQPNVQEITMMDGNVIIPETYRWVSLEGTEPAVLSSSPDEGGKLAAAKRMFNGAVLVRSGDANSFSVSGPLVDKLAHDDREMISLDDALFLLGGLGVEPLVASQKLAMSLGAREPVLVRCGRQLTLGSEAREAAKTAGMKTLGLLPVLRRELWKEAASLPDPTAVDTVLSLGFLNPENLTSFIDALPILEDAQSRMCELLFASRLGMRDIPGPALEKSIKSLEQVIDGLKTLAFQQN